MARKRVFISFRIEDRNEVNGLRLLSANDRFDIESYDESDRTEIRRHDEFYNNTVICKGLKDGPVRLTLPKACRDRNQPWYLWDHELLDRLINSA